MHKPGARFVAALCVAAFVGACEDQPEPTSSIPEATVSVMANPNINPEIGADVSGMLEPGMSAAVTTSTGKSVLIYGPSMSGPTNEQTLAAAAGHAVTVADAATWSSFTTAQFASYDAIVFGDRTCATSTSLLATAEANKATWSAAITGPMYVQGTDPRYHIHRTEAQNMITSGINFAASGPGTGLYMSLSCYYYSAAPGTPVSILSGIGSFQVRGQWTGGSSELATIVDPTHPAMAGLTSAGISNWGTSIHEMFTSFPPSFIPLATNNTPTPYIIATPWVIEVDVDIKPGSDPNSINTKSKGVIPVAILGSATFDVTDVDVTTLLFGPAGASPAHEAGGHIEDVNGDGFDDLVSHYPTQEVGLVPGDIEACVDGATLGGTPINGCDAVNIVK
jgi:hypothetical protein